MSPTWSLLRVASRKAAKTQPNVCALIICKYIQYIQHLYFCFLTATPFWFGDWKGWQRQVPTSWLARAIKFLHDQNGSIGGVQACLEAIESHFSGHFWTDNKKHVNLQHTLVGFPPTPFWLWRILRWAFGKRSWPADQNCAFRRLLCDFCSAVEIWKLQSFGRWEGPTNYMCHKMYIPKSCKSAAHSGWFSTHSILALANLEMSLRQKKLASWSELCVPQTAVRFLLSSWNLKASKLSTTLSRPTSEKPKG